MTQQPLVDQGLFIIEGSRSHPVRHTALGNTPLDERSAWRTDLTTHNTHKRQTSMHPAGFEPTIPASKLPQTHALDCAATRSSLKSITFTDFNPLNPELNPICYLLALLGAHHLLHVSRVRVKSLTLRLLMSYIYGAPIFDVSRSHTTTQHSR